MPSVLVFIVIAVVLIYHFFFKSNKPAETEEPVREKKKKERSSKGLNARELSKIKLEEGKYEPLDSGNTQSFKKLKQNAGKKKRSKV